MRLSILLFLACGVLLAEEPKPRPTVSEKARGDFWKASAIAAQADAAKITADKNKQAAVDAMQTDCGDWKIIMDQQKMEPVCVEPAKPAALATPVQPQSSVAEQPKESDAKK